VPAGWTAFPGEHWLARNVEDGRKHAYLLNVARKHPSSGSIDGCSLTGGQGLLEDKEPALEDRTLLEDPDLMEDKDCQRMRS